MSRHHLMTSVKNEGPYLLEWIAHHRAIGFDEIFVAANDCSDGTFELLEELHKSEFIKFKRNVVRHGEIPQHKGYKVLRAKYAVDECDWLMILDSDEFLCVTIGDRKVDSLTACAADDVDIIALNAYTFGSAPNPTKFDLVSKRFRYRLPEKHIANSSIKTLTRNPARFRGAHNHHLIRFHGTGPLIVMRADQSRFSIPVQTPLWRELRCRAASEITQSMAHYNHYSIKSAAEYLLRQWRGRGAVPQGASKIRHDVRYFEERAVADIFDSEIDFYTGMVQKEIESMLSFPGIKRRQNDIERSFISAMRALSN